MRRWWIRLTCNWLLIGAHCAVRGHDWREHYMAGARITSCGWCGKYRGARSTPEWEERVLRAAAARRAAPPLAGAHSFDVCAICGQPWRQEFRMGDRVFSTHPNPCRKEQP